MELSQQPKEGETDCPMRELCQLGPWDLGQGTDPPWTTPHLHDSGCVGQVLTGNVCSSSPSLSTVSVHHPSGYPWRTPRPEDTRTVWVGAQVLYDRWCDICTGLCTPLRYEAISRGHKPCSDVSTARLSATLLCFGNCNQKRVRVDNFSTDAVLFSACVYLVCGCVCTHMS